MRIPSSRAARRRTRGVLGSTWITPSMRSRRITPGMKPAPMPGWCARWVPPRARGEGRLDRVNLELRPALLEHLGDGVMWPRADAGDDVVEPVWESAKIPRRWCACGPRRWTGCRTASGSRTSGSPSAAPWRARWHPSSQLAGVSSARPVRLSSGGGASMENDPPHAEDDRYPLTRDQGQADAGVPAVGSMSTEPGPMMPAFSASSIMPRAMRSLMLPPGFTRSCLAQDGDRGRRAGLMRTCGVLPMVSGCCRTAWFGFLCQIE